MIGIDNNELFFGRWKQEGQGNGSETRGNEDSRIKEGLTGLGLEQISSTTNQRLSIAGNQS